MRERTISGRYTDNSLTDIVVTMDGRELFMLGPSGRARELSMLDSLSSFDDIGAKLPVLAGSGLGVALEELLARFPHVPVAVVDKEEDILEVTCLRERFQDERITWITVSDLETALTRLTHWQNAHGGKAFLPVIHPFYLRLDGTWYRELTAALRASAKANFWDKAVNPRFASATPRILLITSKYFLVGEMAHACKRLGYSHQILTIEDEEIAGQEFVERLLAAVVDFRPDCVLTMNHLGVDREGVLTDLLERLRLPLGSWFVDNPHLILHLYKKLVSPWTTLFTWDADNLPSLHELGFEHVYHLPLGTDPERFKPDKDSSPPSPAWRSRISFVGNSMVYKVALRMKAGRFPAPLLKGYRDVAAAFGASDERSVRTFILESGAVPARVTESYEALVDNEVRLAYEAMLTWEATRQYRLSCVQETLSFNPLIVGDDGWHINLRHAHYPWRLHPVLTYYTELPRFYQWSEINFNCTSKQMKGAVNQRLFDVPATGSFLITDWREQLDELFEPEKEVVAYKDPGEIPDLVDFYLRHPEKRHAIAKAARERVLAEHTWDHRMAYMVKTLKSIYG